MTIPSSAISLVPEPYDRPLRLGVLISGGGTTLLNFLEQISAGQLSAEVAHVIASRADCGGLHKAESADLSTSVVQRGDYATVEKFSDIIFETLQQANVDLVLLAGFLSFIQIPETFRHRVMNIHPSLIPAFCGHGYFGDKVHEAVLDRGVKITGCTVHFADNEYDHGPIILQRSVPVLDDDTPATIASRVFTAECEAYPEAVRLFAAGRLLLDGQRVCIQ